MMTLRISFAAAVLMAAAVVATGAETPLKSLGTASAPITVEVYSDFQCPSCKALYETVILQMIGEYVDKGKVYLIHRDFPLPMHAHAKQAALYANAAHRLGKYEQVCAALFRKQESWSKDGKVDDVVAALLTPAEIQKVRALVKDPSVAVDVDRDVALGKKANVNQTPTMIVTHKLKRYPLAGAANYSLIQRFFDDLLKR